jgi:isopentenyl-diphosphate delta-isomerase
MSDRGRQEKAAIRSADPFELSAQSRTGSSQPMVGGSKDLILVDLDDRETGYGEKLEVHRQGLLHRAFSVFLFDGDKVLIQRRAEGKYHSAGLWANTCCSHPGPGETVTEAATRRLREECEVEGVSLHEAGSFVYRAVFPNALTEYEFDHVLVGEYAGPFSPDPEESSELRFVPLSQLKQDMLVSPESYAVWFLTALGIAENGRGE